MCHIGGGKAQAVEEITAGESNQAGAEEGSQLATCIHIQGAHVAHKCGQKEQCDQAEECATLIGTHLAELRERHNGVEEYSLVVVGFEVDDALRQRQQRWQRCHL